MNTELFYQIIAIAILTFVAYLMVRNKADVDFFQDELPSGKKTNSLMRFGFVAVLLYALYYCYYQMTHGLVIDLMVLGTLLAAAFGGKVIQKHQETKSGTPNNNDDATP